MPGLDPGDGTITRPAILRPATPGDCDALGAVHARSWQETYRGLLPDTFIDGLTAASRSALWRRVIDGAPVGETRVIVAECDGGVIGFGAITPQRDAALTAQGYATEITALYLLRAHRRKGIGRALVAALAGLVAAQGAGGLALWVLDGNTQPADFYARLGGQIVADKTDTRDAVVLKETAYGWADAAALTHGETR